MQFKWPLNFIRVADPSIEFLELYALTTTLTTWKAEPLLNNARVVIFCDNEAIVHMVNKLASSCEQYQKLIRIIALQGIEHNRKVVVRHI